MNKDSVLSLFTVILFCIILALCLAFNISIVAALLVGLCLFLLYGVIRGFCLKELAAMCLEGVKTAKNVLITLLIIGALTAVWRASGCIPSIVCYTAGLISPKVLVLLTFLLTSLLSTLTGTAFGTAATMGVICVTIARSMGMPLFWVGGAVLSGVFVGDRCSPVSSCALLVSSITETDIYSNIRVMLRTALFPFLLSCMAYGLAGLFLSASEEGIDVLGIFTGAFSIRLICLLPALAVIVLALLRVKVRPLMLVSILLSAVIALTVQKMSFLDLLKTLLLGYETDNAELAVMINGGGVKSMVRVVAIVCIASCYSGIFRKTGLLDFLTERIQRFAEKRGAFPATFLLSIPLCAISCNQTLAVMLTNQLTTGLTEDKERQMLNLSDSVVVIAPLIPWSIAGSVPLATAGVPTVCILAACYLYILPLWRLVFSGKTIKESKEGIV